MPKLIGDKPLTPAERVKRWRERHPERAKEVQQSYHERHPERRKEISRSYYRRNAAAENARTIVWRKANLEKSREHSLASHYRHYEKNIFRMAARRSKEKEFVVIDKDKRRISSQPCAHCGSNKKLHLDHIIPLSRGGNHSVGNLQMLCQHCNNSKHAKVMTEWRMWLNKAA